MGLFKKIFKPVSKVLDKIVPNEVKPFLPYAAAFAPFIAPGIMGTSVMQRALMGGGLNIFGQLSQEGNEGDINLLSAGLGALSGAMSAPGTQASPIGDGAQFVDTGAEAFKYSAAGQPSGAQFFKGLSDSAEGTGVLASGQRFLGDTLAKGSDIMSAGLKEGLFTKAGLKAAALPAATATGDLMVAQNKRDQDAYDDAMAAEAAEEGASNAQRAFAIRRAMEAQGATEEEIEDAIYAAGYQTGGRVGFRFGGIDEAIEMVKEETVEKGKEGIMQAAGEDPLLVEEYNKYVFDLMEQRPNAKPMSFQDFKRMIKAGMKDGGLMSTRINMENGGDLLALGEGFKSKELNDMALNMFGKNLKLLSRDELELLRDEYNIKKGMTEVEAKDGGLMDLGGKEMDLRKGGFVPIGKKERADDVPARLSKNEFVMTADAVRAAGGGSVNEGAKRMYKVMNDLEARA